MTLPFCKKQFLLPTFSRPLNVFCKIFPVNVVKAYSKALCLLLFKTQLMSSTDPQEFFEITHLSYDVTGY